MRKRIKPPRVLSALAGRREARPEANTTATPWKVELAWLEFSGAGGSLKVTTSTLDRN